MKSNINFTFARTTTVVEGRDMVGTERAWKEENGQYKIKGNRAEQNIT